MKCKEVMKTRVVSISVDENVQIAAERMRDHEVGFLPVVASDGKPVGVITDRDIVLRVIAEGRPLGTLVQDVMTTGVVAVGTDADLAVAEEVMTRNQKSRLICIDDAGVVAGVISLSDIPAHESERRAGVVFGMVARRESTPGSRTH